MYIIRHRIGVPRIADRFHLIKVVLTINTVINVAVVVVVLVAVSRVEDMMLTNITNGTSGAPMIIKMIFGEKIMTIIGEKMMFHILMNHLLIPSPCHMKMTVNGLIKMIIGK